MNDLQALGTLTRRTDRLDVQFERFYPHAIETVWSALTDPVRLQDWMGASYVEPRVGGRFNTMIGGPQPMTGHIVVWQPPNVLEFTWDNADAPESVVRYELAREGKGTRLVFVHKGVLYARSALMLPGWHYLLAHLGRLLDGIAETAPQQSWRQLQTVYVEHYQLHDALLDVPRG